MGHRGRRNYGPFFLLSDHSNLSKENTHPPLFDTKKKRKKEQRKKKREKNGEKKKKKKARPLSAERRGGLDESPTYERSHGKRHFKIIITETALSHNTALSMNLDP